MPVISIKTISPMNQVSSPARVQPTVASPSRPQAACMCRYGLAGLVGKEGADGERLVGAGERVEEGHDRVVAAGIGSHDEAGAAGSAAHVEGDPSDDPSIAGEGLHGLVERVSVFETEDEHPTQRCLAVSHMSAPLSHRRSGGAFAHPAARRLPRPACARSMLIVTHSSART